MVVLFQEFAKEKRLNPYDMYLDFKLNVNI